MKYTLGEYWTAEKSFDKAMALATEDLKKYELLTLFYICVEIYNKLSDEDQKYVDILDECLTPKECCIDFLETL